MDPDRLLENERLQMQQIRELDMEELQIEEVDESSSSDDDDNGFLRHTDGQAGDHYFTFDTCLASLHTYLGEVDETHGRLAFLDGGAILNLPMFYLKAPCAGMIEEWQCWVVSQLGGFANWMASTTL